MSEAEKSLINEAEDYAMGDDGIDMREHDAFIAGATSDYVKSQLIEALEGLLKECIVALNIHTNPRTYILSIDLEKFVKK